MGAIADVTNTEQLYDSGLDAVIIRRCVACVVGGRTLDVNGFPDAVIRSGHVIIHDPDTDTYKPMPVADGKYSSLPGSHEYAGVLRASISSEKPFASIMTVGEVNDVAVKYEYTDQMLKDIKAALPGLMFTHD